MEKQGPLVGVIMGSESDLLVAKDPKNLMMQACVDTLKELGISHEVCVVSAHRTPQWTAEYTSTAEKRGLEVIIAAAGGAAHLPGMASAYSLLPVIGVPIPLSTPGYNGLDALASIVQMPGGVPVATMAIGRPGAINAALQAAAILGIKHPEIRERYRQWRSERTNKVMESRAISHWPPDPDPASE